jgi:hypothetical protein
MTHGELPLGLDFRMAGDLQRRIVRALNASGMTYDVIARSASITNASSVRSYVATQRTPRRDSETFRKIDESLRSETLLAAKAPQDQLSAYLDLFKSNIDSSEPKSAFDFQIRKFQSQNNLFLLSNAIHATFHTDHSSAVTALQNLVSPYFMYRCSVNSDQIIRSYVRIVLSAKPRPHILFTHVHPDRTEGVFLDNKPITTIGIVIKTGASIHLLGNAENKMAANFISLRNPRTQRPNILLGFTTVTSDHGLVNSRVVFIRRPDAAPSCIKRLSIHEFKPEEERFEPSLLRAPDGMAADSTVIIRTGK